MASLASITGRCVVTADGCRIWLGAVTEKTGYSRIGHEGYVWLGHRLVFTLAYRALEDGEHVHHQCHNNDLRCVGGPACIHRRCLEPAHLEAVSQQENNRRARLHAARSPGMARTMCKKGLHPWIPENISALGQCLPCKRERQRSYERRVAEREHRTMTDRPGSRKS